MNPKHNNLKSVAIPDLVDPANANQPTAILAIAQINSLSRTGGEKKASLLALHAPVPKPPSGAKYGQEIVNALLAISRSIHRIMIPPNRHVKRTARTLLSVFFSNPEASTRPLAFT